MRMSNDFPLITQGTENNFDINFYTLKLWAEQKKKTYNKIWKIQDFTETVWEKPCQTVFGAQ